MASTVNNLQCQSSPTFINDHERIIVVDDSCNGENIEMTPTMVINASNTDDHKFNNYHEYFNPGEAVVSDGQVVSLLNSSHKIQMVSKKIEEDSARPTWSKKADFLLSIIGFAVDLANIWRFPYLCYKNGGGAFLIPYSLMLVFGALPLFYLELAVGQYNRQGPITLWNICPLFKGIGYCAVIIAFYTSFYYNCIIGWAIYFLFVSVSPRLPWTSCDGYWKTEKCRVYSERYKNTLLNLNTSIMNHMSSSELNASTTLLSNNSAPFEQNEINSSYPTTGNATSPAEEYFYRHVLGLHNSKGFEHLGNLKWQLALCMLTVYAILYFALIKGVKSSGKVVWVTATMPYVVLIILFIRGTLLPGAFKGLKYYVNPDLERLKDHEVWVDAAVQIFYSVGVGFGVHITYASYNKFNNNCYRDCLITSALNSVTSFFSGMVIFTYLGFMSVKHDLDMKNVAAQGHGLVFQVYPEAIATLTGSQFWSVLFFFMLIMLGLDSSMGGLECVVTGIMDEYKHLMKKFKYSREIFTAIVFIISYMVALPNVTEGGAYLVHWFDTYAAGIALLVCAFSEGLILSWVYGSHQIAADIKQMLGYEPSIYWRICWKVISPLFLFIIIVIGVYNSGDLVYNKYKYPQYATTLGWTLTGSAVLMIPGYAVYYLLTSPEPWKTRLAMSISPPRDQLQITQIGIIKRYQWSHYFRL